MYKKLKNVLTIPLDIPKGFYVVCSMTTQAANSITVQITNESGANLITPMTRQSISALPVLSSDFTFRDNTMNISLKIPQSNNIDARMDCIDFVSSNGTLKVRTYIIIAEDSVDEDFNDLNLIITGYAKKG